MAKKRLTKVQFAVCIYDAKPDLEIRKIYRVIADDSASKSRYFRVVDESGEGYLYPVKYFELIDLPLKARRGLTPIS